MKILVLEEFLKRQGLAGSQSCQILEKFLLYVKLVQDPLNVFRYMKEKAICTYFPLFWYTMSQYLAAIGDYRDAFLCLKEAQERKNISQNDENAKILNTSIKAQMYRQEIFNEIRKYPPGKRRSTSEFLLMSEPFEQVYGGEDQKYETLFKLLQTKYTLIRTDKERAFEQKNGDKPKSWLFDTYNIQEIKIFEIIQQTLKMNSDEKSIPTSSVLKKDTLTENQDRLFRSVNTPFKRRDPMRMVKTLDSVEMMKRKRKSEDTKKKKKLFNSNSQELSEDFNEDEHSNDEDEQSQLLINTMPVGKTFDRKKRQVKFEKEQSDSFKIEKPRDNNHIPTQDDSIEVSRKTVRSNKGILRNKEVEKKVIKFPLFSEITERSLKIKKTEDEQI